MTDDWAAFRTLEERVLEHNSRIEQLSPALTNRSFESQSGKGNYPVSYKNFGQPMSDGPPHSYENSPTSLAKSQVNKILSLTKALSERDHELSEARRELASSRKFKEENISLKSQLALLTERLASAERELQFKSKAISEQELKLKDLGSVESELGHSIKQRDALCHELDALHSSLKRSELAEEQLASEVRQRLQAEERAIILQDQINSNHAKMSAYTRGLEEQLRELDGDNAHLKSELARSSGIIDKCQKEFNLLDSLRSELKLKNERFLSVSSELERERKSIQKILREKDGLELRLTEISSKAEGADPLAYLTRLKSRLGETQALQASVAQEASQLETRVKASENKLRLIRRVVRVRLETLAEWVEAKFFLENEGFPEAPVQDSEMGKYWASLEGALMKAKSGFIGRIKDLEKRNKTLAKNTGKIEDVAMKLKFQLENINAKVDGQQRLGAKVHELERQSKSRSKIASDWEGKFLNSQHRCEELCKEHDEIGRILAPLLGEHDDRRTLKSMAHSLASALTRQKSIISESQYRLDELRKETLLLRDQFGEEHLKNEDASQTFNAKIEQLMGQLGEKDKALSAKEADLRKVISANRELQEITHKLQAEVGAFKEDRLRLSELSKLHYRTAVALLRVLMPALQNLADLAAQKTICSNTLFKLEAEIKHFSGSLGLSSPNPISRLRVVAEVVRAVVRLHRGTGAKRPETIKYSGVTLQISPVIPDIPSLPCGDNDQHLIYSLLLNAERSFPKIQRTDLHSITANIDGLKRVFNQAKQQVEISGGQVAAARQHVAELIERQQTDLSTISQLKEKLTKLQFNLTEQSTEFASMVTSHAEVKVRNEELEASLTILQLNTEAISDQLLNLRNQYTELLSDNGLKAKHLEAIQESYDRLQRELEESENARMNSETERNELIQKENVLSEEVMRLTEALSDLRERLYEVDND